MSQKSKEQIGEYKRSHLNKPWLVAFLKVALLVTCLFFLISKLKDQSIRISDFVWPESPPLVLGFVIILMFLNWYLEALRWKVSVQVFEPISIQDAVRIILAGLSLNWVLPFTSGDLLVRLSQQVDKYQTTSAAVLNRGVMISFTAIIGLYGMSKLAEQYDFNGWYALILLLIFPLMTWIFRKTLARFLNYFRSIDRSILIKIVGISFLRYTVFTFQFFLLLETFLPHLPAHLLIAGIGWIFLVRSILPLLLGGVGVREVSGIVFFESHVSNLQMVIIPIFLIWVINTVIPSLVGLIFIWRFKANIAR